MGMRHSRKALFFDQLKRGCGSITLLNLINSLSWEFERGNSLYPKLWTHLRKKLGLRSTNKFFEIYQTFKNNINLKFK